MLADVLADEEGNLADRLSLEVRTEAVVEVVESRPGGLILPGRELFPPGGGRREDELTPRLHESRQAVEEATGFGEPAEEVGRMDEVEGTEVVSEIHGVSRFE